MTLKSYEKFEEKVTCDFQFLLSHPRQKEIPHSPRQHSFENLFPSTAERSGGNYELFYQDSIRKYDDDLEH